MAKAKYHLDGDSIRELRKKRGWSQQELADKAGVVLRTINSVEGNKRPVLKYTALTIADALGATLKALTKDFIYNSEESWFKIPDITSEKHKKLLIMALRHDMDGKHRDAARICEKILSEMPENEHFDSKAAVIIKQASFLDNDGNHKAALRILEHFLNQISKADFSKDVVLWAVYHKAISLRRLGRYIDAGKVLEAKILKENTEHKYRVAAKHQLGVIYLERAKKEGDKILYDKAISFFAYSARIWKKEDNHREGFSLRRIGQLHALKGNTKEAVMNFYNAGIVFARNHCDRYLEENDEFIEKLFIK